MKVHLGISEGCLYITPDDDMQNDIWNLGHGPDFDFLEMAPIAGEFKYATECPAYDTDENCVPIKGPFAMSGYESGSHYVSHGTSCDCHWWPVFIPEEDNDGSN